jgi:glycerophosphoryl diester phosphodiesterase
MTFADAELLRPGGQLMVVAHRGSSGTAPENTIAAFTSAVNAGVDMIELDIRMTKDFHLVVIHDRDVQRTTNGAGFVWDMTLQDLRFLDAGSWFSPRFRAERIPTLREVMDMLPARVGLNIEVKTDGDPRKKHALEESLVLTLREQRMEGRVLVSSFDHNHLRRLHRLDPDLHLGVLYVPLRDLARKPSSIAHRVGGKAFICSRTQIRKRFVDDAHRHDIFVGVYGVNTLRQLAQVKRYGVDAVVSDYPEQIVRAVRG